MTKTLLPPIPATKEERMVAALNFILKHPNLHDQGSWFEFADREGIEAAGTHSYGPPVAHDDDELYDDGEDNIETLSPLELVDPTKEGPLDNCGTVGCLAGWVVSLNRDELIVREYGSWETSPTMVYDPKTGDKQSVRDRAADLLGLDDGEAHKLFHGENTIHELRAGALVILNNPNDLLSQRQERYRLLCDEMNKVEAKFYDEDGYYDASLIEDLPLVPITFDETEGKYV